MLTLFFRPGLSAFLAGAVVLFIELAGSKLLAAVFGSSLYVWSALITITLLSLAIGAWTGGWFADRWTQSHTLTFLWFGASLTMGLVAPLRQLVFPLTGQMDLRLGVLLCSLVLFFLPLAFLAAIPPVLVKQLDPPRDNLGRIVGKISSIGTAGSCFGAIITGFYLVPNFSLTRLFLYFSFFLALGGISTLWKGGKKIPLVLLLIAWSGCLLLFSPERNLDLLGNRTATTTLEIRQSLYGQLQVLENESRRLFFLDGIFQGGISASSGLSLTEYTATMEILGLSAFPSAKKILVVGLGSGVIPSDFQKKGLQVDSVEINPQVIQLCQKWFDLKLPIGRIHEQDGRQFIKQTNENFDLVFLDAFSGEEIPAHLLTLEAFQEIHSKLSKNGALLINYVGFETGPSAKVLSTLAATLRQVFPSVDLFLSGEKDRLSNFIITARMQDGPWTPTDDIPWEQDKTVAYKEIMANRFEPGKPYAFLFTDDYCPLEWLDRQTRFQWRTKCIALMQMNETGI